MLDALSPARRRAVLGAAAVLLVAVLVVSAITVARSRAADAEVPQDVPGPVLLVPGYGGRVASLTPLVDALRAAGRTAVVVEPLGDGTGDLAAQATHLGDVAERVLADSGAPSVDVIGYSAGGVVARLWVRVTAGARVRRVLTLGSPQHGGDQAALGSQFAGGCPPACEQLVPGSDLLRRLNARDETPDGPAWATVRSTTDQVVTPTVSAALDGALNLVVQDLCPGSAAAHDDLPAHPVTRAALTTVLGAGPPRAPAGVAC